MSLIRPLDVATEGLRTGDPRAIATQGLGEPSGVAGIAIASMGLPAARAGARSSIPQLVAVAELRLPGARVAAAVPVQAIGGGSGGSAPLARRRAGLRVRRTPTPEEEPRDQYRIPERIPELPPPTPVRGSVPPLVARASTTPPRAWTSEDLSDEEEALAVIALLFLEAA